MVNETFLSHQEIPAFEFAVCCENEPFLWIWRQMSHGHDLIRVTSKTPVYLGSDHHIVAVINVCSERGQFLQPDRCISICEGIFIMGVTGHVRKERVDSQG